MSLFILHNTHSIFCFLILSISFLSTYCNFVCIYKNTTLFSLNLCITFVGDATNNRDYNTLPCFNPVLTHTISFSCLLLTLKKHNSYELLTTLNILPYILYSHSILFDKLLLSAKSEAYFRSIKQNIYFDVIFPMSHYLPQTIGKIGCSSTLFLTMLFSPSCG